MQIKKRKLSKKIIIAVLAAVIIVVISAFFVYAQLNKSSEKPKKPTTYSGPSTQDKSDAEENKQKVKEREEIENNTNQSSNQSDKKTVTLVITNASQGGDQITINAYISGVFEDGGICRATITKGDKKVERTTQGFADATTTGCQPFLINKSAFSEAGEWGVVVNYSSPTSEGASQVKIFNIQ